MTGVFGVPGENDDGRKVVDFCAETGLCVSKRVYISTPGWIKFKMEWR